MQEKSFFLAKIQQVKREEMRKRWGLTEKKGIIAWDYEEKRAGLGVFFETPVKDVRVMMFVSKFLITQIQIGFISMRS